MAITGTWATFFVEWGFSFKFTMLPEGPPTRTDGERALL